MHKFYFPACPVEGPFEPPVPFSHMGISGAVPNKCDRCDFLFEGECTRYFAELERYMHLDHGPCGIPGPTDPVIYEDEFIRSKVEVPRKCARCFFLFHHGVFGFTCRKDPEKWGQCHRGLDWGSWKPDRIYLDLPHPKISSNDLVEHAWNNDVLRFIVEYRRLNPGLSLSEAREDFSRLRQRIDNPPA